MFEDSLLIIKSDYAHKRKPVLLKLLQKEFQIQGNRRLRFTPELAAEFYNGEDESRSFMLLVIMLSKGNSEAFILTKENCVEDLMNTMVCYFGTSVENERNVHVSRTTEDARREITFIFPNYIHEPIPSFLPAKFANNPLIKETLTEVYDIISGSTGYPQNWKAKLAEWLARSNSTLPIISNQCSKKSYLQRQEQSTLAAHPVEPCVPAHEMATTPSGPSMSFSSVGSSMMMTSSSCITCSCFDGDDTCYKPPEKEDSFELFIKRKTAKHDKSSSVSEEHICEDQDIEWVEIVEDESKEGEEEADIASDQQHDAEKLEEATEVHSERGSERATVYEQRSSIVATHEEVPPTQPKSVEETPPKEPTPAPAEAPPPPVPEAAPPPAVEEAPPPAAEAPPPAAEAPPPPPAEEPPPPPVEAAPPQEEAPVPPPEETPPQEQPPAES